jgi:hypothetical protein
VHPSNLTRQPCRPMLLFVKNGPTLTMDGYERACLLPREPSVVFYKMAADPIDIRDGIMGALVRLAIRGSRLVVRAGAIIIPDGMVVKRRAHRSAGSAY